MSILNVLRDPLWQGIGAILTLITILVVPEARAFLLKVSTSLFIEAKNIHLKSFLVGVAIGIVPILIWSALTTSKPQNASSSSDIRMQIKVLERDSKRPKILEGSHYKLQSNTDYAIQIINAAQTNPAMLQWQPVPDDFGKIDYDPAKNFTDTVYAEYTTPQTTEERGGLIKICELDPDNQCRSLNLPELQIVISPK